MKRKTAGIVLVLAMLLSLCVLPAQAADAPTYSDVSGHWAERAIGAWSGYGVVEGSGGSFRPDASLTRAELAVILDRLMGYQTQSGNAFSDLGDAWYTAAMLRLNAAGVLEGSGGRAMPMGTVSRQEAAVLLGRALQIEPSSGPLPFTDASAVASWAAGYVSALSAAGFLQGYQGTFAPTDPVTRASIVTMLDNMVSAFVHEDGVYSADAEGSLVVNAADVTLKDMTVGGDLIIADGVGGGDVYLDNVKVEGRVILRGCGENSFHVLPGTDLSGSAVIVCKTASGGIRLINESGAPIPMVNVADGRDGVTLTGEFGSVVIASDAPVALKDATVSQAVSVTAPGASVAVTGQSQVARMDVAQAAADASVKVDANSKVAELVVAADGLTMDGKAENVAVADSVKEQPQTSDGKPAEGVSSPGGSAKDPGGSDRDSDDSDRDHTPSVQTLAAVTANLASPQTGKTATDAVPAAAGYTVTTAWTPALVDGKFAASTAYKATLVFTPTAYYRWPAEIPTVAVHNSTSYGGAPIVDSTVLDGGKVTVEVAYPATAAALAIEVDGQPEAALNLIAGNYARRLHASAHVEADGVEAPNYLVSYQWYSATAADRTGAAPIDGAADAEFELPAGLSAGSTYYFFCRMTAEGCAAVDSAVSAVSVTAGGGDEVVLTNLRLTQEQPGSLYLAWDYGSSAKAESFNLKCYSGGTVAQHTIWHTSTQDVNLQYSLADATYASATTLIDKIEFTPQDQSEKYIGPTAELNCQIDITSENIKGVTVTLDPSTKKLTVTGLPTTGGYTDCSFICESTTDKYSAWGKSLRVGNFVEGTLTEDMSENSAFDKLQEPDATVRVLLYTSTLTESSSTATVNIGYTDPLSVVIQSSGN